MKSTRFLPIFLLAFAATTLHAADDVQRAAVIAALEKNGVSTSSLMVESGKGGPAINLGTGLNGSPMNSVNDENLALIAQLPEVERVYLFRGSFTRDGLRRLAALLNLKMLSIYEPAVGPDVFAALAELKAPYRLSLGEYPLTDEILGYLESNRQLKGLEITRQQNLSTAAVARFLDSVDDLDNFWLVGDTIDDVGLARLGAMKNMTRLSLESQKVTPAG